MSDNSIHNSPEVNEITELLTGEDISSSDAQDAANGYGPSDYHDEPSDDNYTPPPLGTKTYKEEDDADTTPESSEVENTAGEERSEGQETVPEARATAPTNFKPIDQIRTPQDFQAAHEQTMATRQELGAAVGRLQEMRANNQISQAQFDAAMLNAQAMHNQLDGYTIALERNAQSVMMQNVSNMNKSHQFLEEKIPGWMDPKKGQQIRDEIRNYMHDEGFDDAAVDGIDNPMVMQFVYKSMMNARKLTPEYQAQQRKAEQLKRAKAKAAREKKAAEKPYDGTFRRGDTSGQVDAIAKLLAG